jgi:hypothetical protein
MLFLLGPLGASHQLLKLDLKMHHLPGIRRSLKALSNLLHQMLLPAHALIPVPRLRYYLLFDLAVVAQVQIDIPYKFTFALLVGTFSAVSCITVFSVLPLFVNFVFFFEFVLGLFIFFTWLFGISFLSIAV